MSRSLAFASLVALAACGGSAPPPAADPAPPPPADPAPSNTVPAPAPPAPFYYPPEHREPFMQGCMGECAPELMCSCMYGKLQWTMSAEDALAGKLTDAQLQSISDACIAELPDPGPLPPGCEPLP